MAGAIVETCVAERPDPEDIDGFADWARYWAPRIARDGDAVVALASRVWVDDMPADDLVELLSQVLDALRMDRENGAAGAESVFELLDAGYAAARTRGEIGTQARMALCSAHIRAGLKPPDCLKLGPEDALPGDRDSRHADPDDLIREILPAGTPPDQAHMILREALGAMEHEATEAFVHRMIVAGGPDLALVGRYFLLDRLPGLRRAAATGVRDLAAGGGVDAAELAALITLRNWMPADAAREILDSAVKDALRREPAGGSVPGAWHQHRVFASLPDGSGSQSIVAAVSRGSTKRIAAVLIKDGHGIKDAYVIPCASASEQRRQMEAIADDMPSHVIAAEGLTAALELALGDGLARGLPPAPGFIDVAPMLGAAGVTPSAIDMAAHLALADPEGEVGALSPSQRGRLIGQSRDWPMLYPIASSWFVSDARLMEGLAAATSERGAEGLVWAHLDAQREIWARVFARSAAILRGADDVAPRAWQQFAAVALGLAEGRPLKKIPVFDFILDQTLDAAEDALFGDDPKTERGGPEYDIAPEGRAEFAELLKGSGLTPEAANGYLTGVLVAPEFVTPTDWLPPLLEGRAIGGEAGLQRVLDILMLRYGEINDRVLDGEVGNAIGKLSDTAFAEWLTGFRLCMTLAPAWPKRALGRDERRILSLIAEAERDEAVLDTLRPLLRTWLDTRARRASAQ